MNTTTTDHGDTIRRGDRAIYHLRDAINSHDPNRVADAHTDDFQSNLPMHPARSFTGNDRVRENWTRMLARVPDLRAEILRAVYDAESGQTWSEWEMTGTTTEGEPALFRGMVITTAREGRIAWNRFYLDEVVDG